MTAQQRLFYWVEDLIAEPSVEVRRLEPLDSYRSLIVEHCDLQRTSHGKLVRRYRVSRRDKKAVTHREMLRRTPLFAAIPRMPQPRFTNHVATSEE